MARAVTMMLLVATLAASACSDDGGSPRVTSPASSSTTTTVSTEVPTDLAPFVLAGATIMDVQNQDDPGGKTTSLSWRVPGFADDTVMLDSAASKLRAAALAAGWTEETSARDGDARVLAYSKLGSTSIAVRLTRSKDAVLGVVSQLTAA